VVGEPVAVDGLAWTSAPAAANGQTAVPVPAGWVVEPVGPSPCPGLPPPSAVAAASPPRDLTVVLRVAVWPARDVAPAAAALACASGRGSAGAASYTSRATWLGVSYVIEGVFASLGQNRVVQLEVLSTDQNSARARAAGRMARQGAAVAAVRARRSRLHHRADAFWRRAANCARPSAADHAGRQGRSAMAIDRRAHATSSVGASSTSAGTA